LRRLVALLLLALPMLPGAAAAQRFDGTVAGTLDCPARSLFESGTTQVRGNVRNNQLTVGLGPLSVSGRIVELGPQPAVRLEGSSAGHSASFDGLVIGGGQLHARGIFDERPCNLNLRLSIPPTPPGRQQVLTQPARGLPSLDGPWQGTVSCPLSDLSGDDRIAARASVSDNILSVDFASIRAQGRIAGVSPRPALRIEGGNSRGVGAGFNATMVTPNRIEARGLVGGQPCQLVLTPTRLPPVDASPAPRPAAPVAPPSVAKPAPSGEPPPMVSAIEKPAPSNAPPTREPEQSHPPPVATVTPRPAPPPPPPAPTQAAPRAPSPEAADQLACALAGTCASPGR
jgi:hypothetical protein